MRSGTVMGHNYEQKLYIRNEIYFNLAAEVDNISYFVLMEFLQKCSPGELVAHHTDAVPSTSLRSYVRASFSNNL
jgi:hypothetical protein